MKTKTKLRATKFYKELTPYIACETVEWSEDATEQEQIIAWQYIADKKLWQGLQGWYGRTVHQLKETGIIQ